MIGVVGRRVASRSWISRPNMGVRRFAAQADATTGASTETAAASKAVKTGSANATGTTARDVVGFVVLSGGATAYLLYEVKDLDDPPPPKKQKTEETKTEVK